MEKSGFNFKKVLGRIFYEDTTSSEDTTTPTAAQEEAFNAALNSENNDVVEMARQLIFASQETCDNDELPDISNVMNAVETAGSGENHELIRRMIQNLMGMNPDDLYRTVLIVKKRLRTPSKLSRARMPHSRLRKQMMKKHFVRQKLMQATPVPKLSPTPTTVSYTHLTLPTMAVV